MGVVVEVVAFGVLVLLNWVVALARTVQLVAFQSRSIGSSAARLRRILLLLAD